MIFAKQCVKGMRLKEAENPPPASRTPPEEGICLIEIPSNRGVAEGRGGFFPMEVPSNGGVAEGRGGFFPMEVPSNGGVAEGRGGFFPSG